MYLLHKQHERYIWKCLHRQQLVLPEKMKLYQKDITNLNFILLTYPIKQSPIHLAINNCKQPNVKIKKNPWKRHNDKFDHPFLASNKFLFFTVSAQLLNNF